MNTFAVNYYQLMNLLDSIALRDCIPTEDELSQLNVLLTKSDSRIEDIADANDCGICKTWNELLTALHELFLTGERI